MAAHRFLILALALGAAAQSAMDDATFESVSRELEADLSAEASDLDEAFRRLSNGSMTTTAAPTQAPLTVAGNLKLSGFTAAQATAFVGNDNAKLALRKAIANKAGSSVGHTDVELTLTIEDARRLGEIDAAEPRALQATKKVNVAYVVTFPAGTTEAAMNTIADTLTAVTGDAFKTEIDAQLATAGVAGYTLTVENLGASGPGTSAPTTTTAPVVDGATKMAATSSMLVLLSAWLFSA